MVVDPCHVLYQLTRRRLVHIINESKSTLFIARNFGGTLIQPALEEDG